MSSNEKNCPLCGKTPKIWKFTGIGSNPVYRKIGRGNTHICEDCLLKDLKEKSKIHLFLFIMYHNITRFLLDRTKKAFSFIFGLAVLMSVVYCICIGIGEFLLFLYYKTGLFSNFVNEVIFQSYSKYQGTYNISWQELMELLYF